MKTGMLRGIGVVAALLIPAGGLTLLGAGVAGASTSGSASFGFVASSHSVNASATCTPTTYTGSPVASVDSPACTTSGTGGSSGVGTPTSASLAGTLTETAPALEVGTDFALTVGSTTCKVTLTKALGLTYTTLTNAYSGTEKTAGHVSVTHVVGSGKTCTSLKALLETTPSSTFTVTLKP
jgi:hypothetical protein